jgi:hypothetical protein
MKYSLFIIRKLVLSLFLGWLLIEGATSANAEAVPAYGHPPGPLRFETMDLLGITNHHIAASNWTVGHMVWFGIEDGLDLSELRVGTRRRGGVPYYVVDFHTAPANEGLVLGKDLPHLPLSLTDLPEASTLEVGSTADRIYLLHAAHIPVPVGEEPATPPQPEDNPVVVAVTLNFADDTHHTVHLHLGIEIDRWLHPESAPDLKNAVKAWGHRYRDMENRYAALYSHSFPNPHPEREIVSILFALPPAPRQMAYILVGVTLGKIPPD